MTHSLDVRQQPEEGACRIQGESSLSSPRVASKGNLDFPAHPSVILGVSVARGQGVRVSTSGISLSSPNVHVWGVVFDLQIWLVLLMWGQARGILCDNGL